jgi:ergothioneine biosynthesis protein EgtB
LKGQVQQARSQTDALFSLIKPGSFFDRPIPERHRIVFYVGHLEAFDWNLLAAPLGLAPFAPELDRLFAFGIDPVDGGLPQDQPSDWPPLQAVFDYRDQVRKHLDDALPAANPQLLRVSIEHRLMHAETLAYMFHQLPVDRKIHRPVSRVLEIPTNVQQMVAVPQGPVTLGLSHESGEFGWDNEFEAHTLHVPAFTIDNYKVSNAQFLSFIEDGGYNNRELWSALDWQWKTDKNITHPGFWLKRGQEWSYRGMFEEIALPLAWPVYVSHAEASAYCRWADKELPTEPQWHRAAKGSNRAQDVREDVWDPWPVSASPLGSSSFGVEGMIANGWEWTATPFAPFKGFRAFPFYPGYSADFFDDKHYVLKGGSVRTPACFLRPSFRNWFQPHYQYAYTTFRCVGKGVVD